MVLRLILFSIKVYLRFEVSNVTCNQYNENGATSRCAQKVGNANIHVSEKHYFPHCKTINDSGH